MSRHVVWFERPIIEQAAIQVATTVEVRGNGHPDPLHGLGESCGALVGATTFDATIMSGAPFLRVIARTGIGVDRVDVEEATRRGIVVCNAPDAPSTATAEHTIALILAVGKRIPMSQDRLASGEPDLYARHTSFEFDGATLGLVGFGRIGREVAKRADALGMHVLVFDPYLDHLPPGVTAVATLHDLLRSADVVSLHLPLTPNTSGMIGRREFEVMRPGAILINAARGGLVDHDALLDALNSGQLFGTGLDVTEPEPLPPHHRLLSHPHAVVTPHVASATTRTRRLLFETAFQQVIEVLRGDRPGHAVNPSVFDRPQATCRHEASP